MSISNRCLQPVVTLVLLAGLLGACSSQTTEYPPLPDVSAVRTDLAFTCAHEANVLPPLDGGADALFRYARYLQKKQGPKDYESMAVYYRIAAAHGHYKANRNLQNLLVYGQASSPGRSKEVIELAGRLIDEGVPGGYYDIGHYLQIGYGLKQDAEMSLKFFRKAADLGNPDAQYYVARLLAPRNMAPDVALQMLTCAVAQGHGKAAAKLGLRLRRMHRYADAVDIFQNGVSAGNSLSALMLERGFSGQPSSDGLNNLSLPADSERSLRYEQIGNFLDRYEHLNPKIPDIDQIVPLPPAKLPPWDGTFQWVREHDAAVPPEKPSEELVNRLSQARNLDPATGLSLAQSAAEEPSR